jgi:hypothetical protein
MHSLPCDRNGFALPEYSGRWRPSRIHDDDHRFEVGEALRLVRSACGQRQRIVWHHLSCQGRGQPIAHPDPEIMRLGP